MRQDWIDPSAESCLGTVSRRVFLERVSQLAGGTAGAMALVPDLGAQAPHPPTPSPQVSEDDPSLATRVVSYDGGDTKISGYLARKKDTGKLPAILVIHENRGLTPHIRDVARRFAREGFLALAPDMLSPLGGTPPDEKEAVEKIGRLDQEATVARLAAAVKFLASLPDSTGKVGVVGFCWGGGMTNRVMASGAGAAAGVPYYGAGLPAEQVPKISGPLLLQYAGDDARINAGVPAFEAALKANGKPYEKHVYEGAQHAFNNDSNPARYNKEAATLAWQRTIAFLKKYLQ